MDFKRKNIRSKNGIASLFWIEPSMLELNLDSYFVKKVVEVHDFVPDLKVDRFMPFVIDNIRHFSFIDKN